MAEQEILFSAEDERFMQMAIDLAKQAALEDEVPIGAVIVQNVHRTTANRQRKHQYDGNQPRKYFFIKSLFQSIHSVL